MSVCVSSVTAEELWRGVLAETGAGARKGRGKRTKRKMKKDLNRGQMLGEGETSSVIVSLCLYIGLFDILFVFKISFSFL